MLNISIRVICVLLAATTILVAPSARAAAQTAAPHTAAPHTAAAQPAGSAALDPPSLNRRLVNPAASPAPSDTVDPRAVQPERPTVATHAGTVAPGFLEVEAGVERDRLTHAASALAAPILFKIGVARRVQLDLATPFARTDAGSGIGDVAVGLKWRLADGAPLLGDFALQPGIAAPTGSLARGTGSGTTASSLLLISSHDLGGVAMDLNAGITRRGGAGKAVPRTATLWTASFGGTVDGKLGWVGELFGDPGTGGPAGQRGTAAVLAGPTLEPARWLALDAGLIVPLTGPQPHGAYLGGVYNVGRLH